MENPYLAVTSGCSGFFVVLVVDGEIWTTGVGRYATREEAVVEAKGWAEAEELPFKG